MSKLVTLVNFIEKALSVGVNLEGSIVLGEEYSYKFIELEDGRVVVGYGGDYSTQGKLSPHLTVKKLSFSDNRGGRKQISMRLDSPLRIHLNRSI